MRPPRAKDVLIAASLLVVGRRRRRKRLLPGEVERVVPDAPPARPDAERWVIALLLAAAVCAAAFPVIYALDFLPNRTQLFGASLGLAFLFIGAALVLLARTMIVTEELEEDYPVPAHPEEQSTLVQVVEESGTRITRKRLLLGAAGAAGGTLGLALITPVVSLGPVFDIDPLYRTPWGRGRRIVDVDDRPLHAAAIEEANLYLGFAEGADKEDMASSIVLIRMPPSSLALPREDDGFDAGGGILAFSRICTHAGCAISLYRTPLFQEDSPPPALVCPCHYSTFDPATGGQVTFGPAGRKLPMLPLEVDAKGVLHARGNFDGPIGPSWWGVRMKAPRGPGT